MTKTFLAFLKAFGIGFFGTVSLLGFYFTILVVLSGDVNYPWQQFKLLQPWMSILVVGFGLQLALFSLVKQGIRIGLGRRERQESTVVAGTNTAISGVSMVACCAHHLIEIVPVLGFAGVALFLSSYQKELLLTGVIANSLGIVYMLWLLLDTGMSKREPVFLGQRRQSDG